MRRGNLTAVLAGLAVIVLFAADAVLGWRDALTDGPENSIGSRDKPAGDEGKPKAVLEKSGGEVSATQPARVIRSYRLKYADAEKVADVLRRLFQESPRWRDEPLTITVDQARNELTVSARPALARLIGQLLEHRDPPRD